MTLPVVFTANGPSGYNLTKSLRFRSSASAYLNRTPASSGNRRTFTISAWVKRGSLSVSDSALFTAWDGTNRFYSRFEADNTLSIYFYTGGAAYDAATAMVFRDPSAWYHIVIAVDTTQATASNRVKIYVNGTQQTFSSTVPQNTDTQWNYTVQQNIGKKDTSGSYFDGYMTDVYSIDGQALTPSSFGSTNALTGVWQPAKYTGTYGTNGFYLPFTDVATTSGSNAGLGKDFSGNGNYWNTNNISVTAGTTYDSMTDVPTLTSATTANYCTWNPLLFYSTTAPTLSNGNLTAAWNNTSMFCGSTMALPNGGKTYAEFTLTTANTTRIGIKLASDQSQYNGGWTYVANSGTIRDTTDTVVQTVASSGNNDIIAIAVDLNANTLQFYKNNATLGTAITIANASNWVFWVGQNGSGSAIQVDANFGQQPFSYTPPTGFVALNTYNLPTSTIVKGNTVMDAVTYTGSNSTQSVVNGGSFKPDFTWFKTRNLTDGHDLVDSVRGASQNLYSNTTAAEDTVARVTSFDSNGVTLAGGYGYTNASGQTYVSWMWQAGQGTTSSNTSGSITSTVSVNATAGFSVVTYTGTGANATVGHGLGVAPKMIIVKARSTTGAWGVYHGSLTPAQVLYLNTTDAVDGSGIWNSTAPTSSVFSIGAHPTSNPSGQTLVAYCWSEIAGFSKFGSYTGNGSTDGPFIYLGFRPKFVMIKDSSNAGQGWALFDTSRNPYNVASALLQANVSDAEINPYSGGPDILSNGFKTRGSSSNPTVNTSGATYIYMAFAENPFKNALAR